MSSDTFRYHVDRVEGRDVWLTIRPSGAAGFCDLASTRSFVLMLLAQRAPAGRGGRVHGPGLAPRGDEAHPRIAGRRRLIRAWNP